MCYLYLMETAATPTLILDDIEPDGNLVFEVVGHIRKDGSQAFVGMRAIDVPDWLYNFVAECIEEGDFFPA